MIVIMKSATSEFKIKNVKRIIEGKGLETSIFKNEECCIIGILGDISTIDRHRLQSLSGVAQIKEVKESFKRVNRAFKPKDTLIKINNSVIGGNKFVIIANLCSVQNEQQIVELSNRVKKLGANFLSTEIFEPRASPYNFQSLEVEKLKLLQIAKQKIGLPIVMELASTNYLDIFIDNVDVIQIGARNMQNFNLLKQIGKTNKPILLVRGISSTIEEWLMSAEYIIASGNKNIILCESGIRTFESIKRNTLDLQAVPVIKKLSHLPIIIAPIHTGGCNDLVKSMASAAVSAGAHGIMIKVCNNQENELNDGQQSLALNEFDLLMNKVKRIAEFEGMQI